MHRIPACGRMARAPFGVPPFPRSSLVIFFVVLSTYHVEGHYRYKLSKSLTEYGYVRIRTGRGCDADMGDSNNNHVMRKDRSIVHGRIER